MDLLIGLLIIILPIFLIYMFATTMHTIYGKIDSRLIKVLFISAIIVFSIIPPIWVVAVPAAFLYLVGYIKNDSLKVKIFKILLLIALVIPLKNAVITLYSLYANMGETIEEVNILIDIFFECIGDIMSPITKGIKHGPKSLKNLIENK